MAGITTNIAQQRLNDYLNAEAACLAGQEVRLGDKLVRNADLAEIRKGIEYWSAQVEKLAAGGRGPRISGISLG